jgi:hypothetical protein
LFTRPPNPAVEMIRSLPLGEKLELLRGLRRGELGRAPAGLLLPWVDYLSEYRTRTCASSARS